MAKFICVNKNCEEYDKPITPHVTPLEGKIDSYGNTITRKTCPTCGEEAEIGSFKSALLMHRNIRYSHGAKNGLKGSIL